MRRIDYKFTKRWPSGHYNPHHNILITIRGKRVELEHGGGSKDHIHVFKEDDRVYVLGINHGLGYVSLNEYSLASEPSVHDDYDEKYVAIDTSADVFMDRDYDIEETFGKRGLDLNETTILKRLMEHLPY